MAVRALAQDHLDIGFTDHAERRSAVNIDERFIPWRSRPRTFLRRKPEEPSIWTTVPVDLGIV